MFKPKKVGRAALAADINPVIINHFRAFVSIFSSFLNNNDTTTANPAPTADIYSPASIILTNLAKYFPIPGIVAAAPDNEVNA